MVESDNNIEFSVIVTCYYEEKSIDEFYGRLSATMQKLGRSYELVMINDGSTDGTFEKLKAIYEKDKNVSAIIDFYRNSGQAAAVTAGIQYARGQHFILLDSDLELDPEEIPLLAAEFDKGYDIVSGYREQRYVGLFRTVASRIENLIVRKLARHDIKDFGCTFKIIDGRLVRAFEFGPHKVFHTGHLYSRAGKIKDIRVSHHPRKYGRSGWTFTKLYSLHMDNILGMSRRPFQLLSLACLFLSVLFVGRIIMDWIFPFSILKEVTNGLILNAIFLSILVSLSVLTAIGEYVIRNYIVLQQYPHYIVKQIMQRRKCAHGDNSFLNV